MLAVAVCRSVLLNLRIITKQLSSREPVSFLKCVGAYESLSPSRLRLPEVCSAQAPEAPNHHNLEMLGACLVEVHVLSAEPITQSVMHFCTQWRPQLLRPYSRGWGYESWRQYYFESSLYVSAAKFKGFHCFCEWFVGDQTCLICETLNILSLRLGSERISRLRDWCAAIFITGKLLPFR